MASTPKKDQELQWHEWLCKTNFSFLIGASHPHEVIERAIDLNYSSLCINDFDGVYGLARSYRALKKHKTKLKLHYGAEVHLQQDHHLPILLQETLTLVALNWQGYYNLCHIISQSHKHGKNNAFIDHQQLLESPLDGIAIIQPMRGSIRNTGIKKDFFQSLQEACQKKLYFAISRHLHLSEDYWINQTISLATQLNAHCLVSQDAFFHRPQRKPMSDLLHSIRNNLTIETASQHFFPNCERYLQRKEALFARYRNMSGFQQAMINSHCLSEQIDFDLSMLRYQYPKEMIPNDYSPQQYLEELTWKGVKKRHKLIPAKITSIISHELELIEKLEFADYFLTVWDIVRWARSQGILCQGRGSAANSAVCFFLGITSVDPTLFDLLFERFISMERGDPPDIDVDFEHERREEVIQYIYKRYGRERSAMVANVITFRNKGALRASGKALAVPELILSEASKLSSSKLLRQFGAKEILNHMQDSKAQAYDLFSIPWTLWGELAEELKGFPRNLGIHSGGFMLSHQPLNKLVAQEPATMDHRSVIQWSKEDIEALGFFKIDILALGMLTALRKAFTYIRQAYGHHLDLASLKADDPATYQMIQRADTVGTFQIESRAQMSMLPRLRPQCFYDLVIEIAIIRPGPIQGKVIHPYLLRRQGKEAISFPDEKLRPIQARTLGIAIFQEQAMRVAVAVGNFTAGEANELRKNIGAWNVKAYEQNLNPWLHKLEQGMRQNNYDEDFIQQILKQMSAFSDYGFPESHAVSFALIAYASCYLKCHYPAAFFTAVLNSQPMGCYSIHTLLQAAKRDRVTVLDICINQSNWDHQLEKISQSGKPAVFAIRLGFRIIHGLQQKSIELLQKKRLQLGGSFQNLDLVLKHGLLARSDLIYLAAANAFSCFGISRLDALWLAEAAPFHESFREEEEKLEWAPEDPLTNMQRDFNIMQTSTGDHPSLLIKNIRWDYPIPLEKIQSAQNLSSMHGRQMIDTFGMVLSKQAPPSAKGMVFLTLEDESGFINLVFTPQIYKLFHSDIEKQAFLCIRGQLQKANDYHSILVKNVYKKISKTAAIKSLEHHYAFGHPRNRFKISKVKNG